MEGGKQLRLKLSMIGGGVLVLVLVFHATFSSGVLSATPAPTAHPLEIVSKYTVQVCWQNAFIRRFDGQRHCIYVVLQTLVAER